MGGGGWVQCYSFFAFDKEYPGMIKVNVLRMLGECSDGSARMFYKFSQGTEHSGWEFEDGFYAFDVPVRGSTRFFVQISRKPERYRVGLDRALPPWFDVFSFYAYFVPFGAERLLNFPKTSSL